GKELVPREGRKVRDEDPEEREAPERVEHPCALALGDRCSLRFIRHGAKAPRTAARSSRSHAWRALPRERLGSWLASRCPEVAGRRSTAPIKRTSASGLSWRRRAPERIPRASQSFTSDTSRPAGRRVSGATRETGTT